MPEEPESEGNVDLTEAEYRLLVEGSNLGILVGSLDSVLFSNENARRFFARAGADPAVKTAAELMEFVHPEDRPKLSARSPQYMAGMAVGPLEFRTLSASGEVHWYRSSPTFVRWRGQPAVLTFLEDIDAYKQAEADLRDSQERYRDLVTRAPIAIAETDVGTGRFVLVNDVACDMLGYTRDELLSLRASDILPADLQSSRAERARRMLSGEFVADSAEYRVRTKGGRELWVVANVHLWQASDGSVRAGIVAHDVTARKKAEDELHRIERLDSIGVLAGGIAHDFNNILTAVSGSISLSRLLKDDAAKERLLAEAERAVERARALTQQLLTFSKGGVPIRKTAQIGELTREWATFALRGSAIDSHFDIPRDLWAAEVDQGQMSQVIHNLCINAVQASPASGAVEIGARNVELGPEDGTALPPGRYVVLSIRDHGVGIPSEHMQRIFDPFFTTKASGSGLGLATSASIVQRHGGLLRAESEVGVGSTFHVYLPAAAAAPTDSVAAPPSLSGGKGTVLVMDDDEMVRQVGTQMLRHLGYDVVAVASGADAVEEYAARLERGAPFLAVIVDLTVPGGMGGLETIAELRKLDRDVRAVIASGYANAPALADAADHGFVGVIAKPFGIADLDRALQEVVAGRHRVA